MNDAAKFEFDVSGSLAHTGLARRPLHFKPKTHLFCQGSPANCLYYLQTGRAKLTVISNTGKEATITLLSGGNFLGEDAILAANGLRTVTATSMTACSAIKIERDEMLRVLHEDRTFSNFFLKFLLQRNLRTQEDLVDQLFNSSEKRLARMLLLMADFGNAGEPAPLLPPITQETLAEMIGTTRSRVSFFMNRFRKLGLIEYHGRIRIHKSLLKVVLLDRPPEEAAGKEALLGRATQLRSELSSTSTGLKWS